MPDALTWYVMDATADDWESLEQILPHVNRFCDPADAGMIAKTVARLVSEGLMEEMQHSPVDIEAVLQDPIEYWFRMTKRGREIWEAERVKYPD